MGAAALCREPDLMVAFFLGAIRKRGMVVWTDVSQQEGSGRVYLNGLLCMEFSCSLPVPAPALSQYFSFVPQSTDTKVRLSVDSKLCHECKYACLSLFRPCDKLAEGVLRL